MTPVQAAVAMARRARTQPMPSSQVAVAGMAVDVAVDVAVVLGVVVLARDVVTTGRTPATSHHPCGSHSTPLSPMAVLEATVGSGVNSRIEVSKRDEVEDTRGRARCSLLKTLNWIMQILPCRTHPTSPSLPHPLQAQSPS